MSTTVRVSDETHERLVRLAGATDRRIQAIVEDAVTAYEADTFWSAFEVGYQRLVTDPEHWAEVQAERAGEGPALADRIDGP